MEKQTKMLEREQKKERKKKKNKGRKRRKNKRSRKNEEKVRQAKATCRGKKGRATTARVTRSKSGRVRVLADLVSNVNINETDSEETDGSKSEAECPGCGLVYGSVDDSQKWVQCDVCGAWWDVKAQLHGSRYWRPFF